MPKIQKRSRFRNIASDFHPKAILKRLNPFKRRQYCKRETKIADRPLICPSPSSKSMFNDGGGNYRGDRHPDVSPHEAEPP